ncbi:MAG: MBL fold metallo-hydrolase [Deltaproteobacteria bacterium]|nr:MBL fold metallo-hydrolase [Deltaproteobacteria bacterium]MBW2259421.1 MBL fold metallo-hydrolase [Deltaproteobacteria bacterium]
MKITIIGSGTCVPSLKRSSCSVLIEISQDLLLFDSGAGTMRRLLEVGVSINQLSYIFYSHLHPDHTGELIPFLFATKYPEAYRRRKPFTIVAARGFVDFYETLKQAYGEWIELDPGLLNVSELDTRGRDHLDCGMFDVDSLPMDHTHMSLAYRITGSDGRSVVYSGDTDVCDNLVTLAKGVDVLICESALPDEMKVEGHLTPSLAGRIAAQAGVKKLVLTHFYPECDAVDITEECRKTYQGPLVVAEDLMEIEMP